MPVILAGAAMGFINALGNLGGFVGPYVGGWLQDLAGGSFRTTSFFLAACLLAAGLVALTLRRRGDRPVEDVEAVPAPSTQRGAPRATAAGGGGGGPGRAGTRGDE